MMETDTQSVLVISEQFGDVFFPSLKYRWLLLT